MRTELKEDYWFVVGLHPGSVREQLLRYSVCTFILFCAMKTVHSLHINPLGYNIIDISYIINTFSGIIIFFFCQYYTSFANFCLKDNM